MNIKIAPSILSADFANLERDIRKIDTADYVHVDIMDGEFVPNISIGIPVVKAIRPVTGLPLDVHLMITKPVRYVEQFCDAGADLVTVHVESDFPENIHAALEKIHAKGKRAGIVLKPNTRAEAALPYLKECDIVLVMTVEPAFPPALLIRIFAVRSSCSTVIHLKSFLQLLYQLDTNKSRSQFYNSIVTKMKPLYGSCFRKHSIWPSKCAC